MENNVQTEPSAETLFEGVDESASALFAGLETEFATIPDKVEANPATTQVAAMANSDPARINVDDPFGTSAYLQSEIETARARLEANEEGNMRRKLASKQSIDRQLRNSTAISAMKGISPALQRTIYESSAVHLREDYQKNIRTALEREALDRVQDLAAAGDTTQAKILLNRYTPGKESVNDVWNDYTVTNMALMQRYERAKEDDANEGWGAAVYTGILNLLQPSSFSYLGNVDEGVGGYTPNYWRFFYPGTEQGEQVRSFWSMPAEQRLEYMDKMDANVMNNSVTLGVSNPDKRVELYEQFLNPNDEVGERSANRWNAFELGSFVAPYIGIVPYRALGRAASIPGNLLAAGARKEAANSVSVAYDAMLKGGVDAAKKATGLNEDDVVDNMLPSIINSRGVGDMPDTHVSLSGEVNEGIEKARETVRTFQLTNTERMTTQEEITASYEAAVEEASKKFGGAVVLDVEMVTHQLADGTVTRGIKATLGKPGGGVHGTEAEARGYASSFGYSDVGVERIGPETRIVSHEEDGFTVDGWHGAKIGDDGKPIENFDDSKRGTNTGAASAKKAHFIASPRGAYKGWTKLEWEQHADLLEKEAAEISEILSKNSGILGITNRPKKADFMRLYEIEYKQGEHWFKKAYPDFKTWWSAKKRPLVGEAKGRFAVDVSPARIMDGLEDEIRLARSANPEDAANIAYSYARMNTNGPLDGGLPTSNEDLLDGLSTGAIDPYLPGSIIYPVKIKGQNLKVVKGNRNKYDDVVFSDELDLAKAEGYDGVVFRDASDPGNIDPSLPYPQDGSYDVIAMFKADDLRMKLSPGKVVKDTSGGYAIKVEMDIPDTAFLSNPLSPPPQGFLAKFWKNTSQTSDKSVFAKAVQADSKFARFQQIIDKTMAAPFRKLKVKERAWLNQVLAKGHEAEVWFTDDQFKQLVERSMGKPPSENMVKAYHQYRLNNDIEYVLRNDGVYREKVIRKYESFKFNAQNAEYDLDGVMMSGAKVPPDRIYNVSDAVHYAGNNSLNKARLTELMDQGYKLIRLEKNIKLGDEVRPRFILIKAGDLDIRPLRRSQLPYRAGGHRLYSDPIFIKQARRGTHPDTGQEFFEEPYTMATARNVKEGRDYAKIMEAARNAVAAGKDASYLDEVVFAGKGGPIKSNLPYPSGEEFIRLIDEGRISKTETFEAVYDREMPSAYRQSAGDLSRFMDEEDLTGLPGYYRQLGQMYYSRRGEHLRSASGGLAPVVDPFEAQSRALSNVARMSGSFSDFKTNAVERWVKTYGNDLDTGILSDESSTSPYQIFINANVRNNVPPALRQQILGQRESIKRILGFQSEFERGYQTWLRSMSEWVIGDSDNALRTKISEGLLWMEDANPIGFLRGIAFDMKLGMFNVGQFFIQTSTMASALALNPKHGKFGLASALPVWSYFLSKGNENVLETLTKRGVHKLAGFNDAETFKKYIREAKNSGFFSLGDTHAQVNDFGFASTFGSLGEKAHSAREMGRFFFYNAEVLNRLVAHRIGFGEAVEKFGIDAMDEFEFREFTMARAENYSFNMSGVSKASWQHGILSVPTQFWAYQVRMIEAMTGKNFDNAQKLRLVGMQLLMAGSAGVPIYAGVTEYIKNKSGVEPDIDTMLGTVDRGLGDRLIYEMFGADVLASEKWGTGSWSSDLVKDLLGMSEYNEKSFADIALGATGSIIFTTMGPVFELAKYYMTHESGAEQIDMDSEQWLKLAKNISTFGNAHKAMVAYNYGIYKSNKGNVLAEGLPSEDAFFIALGMRPHEMDVMQVHSAYNNNRADLVKEAASQIVQWRQDAFTRPDDMQETAMKVNAYVQMLPLDIRKDVLNQAQRKTDSSLYRSIEERYKKNLHKEEVARIIEGNQQ